MHRVTNLFDLKIMTRTKIMTEEFKEALKSLNSMIDNLPQVRPASLDSNQNKSLEPPEKKWKIF